MSLLEILCNYLLGGTTENREKFSQEEENLRPDHSGYKVEVIHSTTTFGDEILKKSFSFIIENIFFANFHRFLIFSRYNIEIG